jgi:transposase
MNGDYFAMSNFHIGIDIGKLTFVSAIKVNEKNKTKTFKNRTEGFDELLSWIKEHSTAPYHFTMESTGKYGLALSTFLYQNNYLVSNVNPTRIKKFMQCHLSRNKTDKVDAKYIRLYSESFNPQAWKPLSSERQVLCALVKRRETIEKMILEETNRLELADNFSSSSIQSHIDYLTKEVKEIIKATTAHVNKHPTLKESSKLMCSITGIADKTANKVLAYFGDASNFKNPKQMSAFAGLNPQHFQSGSSLNHSRLSKIGNSELRRMFYMPALVAIRCEPNIQAFYNKLVRKGKPKKLAVCAVMRKLIHIIYGVLKNQKPFDSNLLKNI